MKTKYSFASSSLEVALLREKSLVRSWSFVEVLILVRVPVQVPDNGTISRPVFCRTMYEKRVRTSTNSVPSTSTGTALWEQGVQSRYVRYRTGIILVPRWG